MREILALGEPYASRPAVGCPETQPSSSAQRTVGSIHSSLGV